MNTLRSGVLAAPLLVYAPFLVKTCPIRSHAQLNCWPHNWLRCPENNVPRPRADDHSQQKLEPYRLPNYIHRQVKHKEEIDQNFKSFFFFCPSDTKCIMLRTCMAAWHSDYWWYGKVFSVKSAYKLWIQSRDQCEVWDMTRDYKYQARWKCSYGGWGHLCLRSFCPENTIDKLLAWRREAREGTIIWNFWTALWRKICWKFEYHPDGLNHSNRQTYKNFLQVLIDIKLNRTGEDSFFFDEGVHKTKFFLALGGVEERLRA